MGIRCNRANSYRIAVKTNATRLSIALLAILWALTSWMSAAWYADRKTEELIAHESEMLESDSLALFQAFEERFNYLSTIPSLIGRMPGVTIAVNRYSREPNIRNAGTSLRSYWSEETYLNNLNTELRQLTKELQIDVAFILNSEGYCIASSNSNTPESFVGTRYNDRHYFRIAIQGESAHQYAVGRKTNIPGLFYSAPIRSNDRTLGVLVIKSDISNFQNLLAPYNAFLTDNHDVIVLASVPSFLQHMLPKARFENLLPEEKLQQYKRTEFPILESSRWNGAQNAPLLRLNGLLDPILMSERQIPGGDLVMHVFQSAPEVRTITHEKIAFAVIATLAGFSIFSVAIQLTLYLRKLRHSKTLAEAESERLHDTLSEREQQLDTIINHLPLMVTARDPETFAVLSSNDAAKSILGLPQPLSAGESYGAAVSENLSQFLTACDQQTLHGSNADTTRELQIGNRVLKAQTLSALDRDGQPKMLIDLVEDISQQRRDEAEIRRLAFVDTLTGLNNRTSFKHYLEKTVSESVTDRVYGAMILVDLDAFKQMNDRFGHSLGDQLLKELAHRLNADTAAETFLARLASDEFVVVINTRSHNREDASHHATLIANALFRRITQPYLIDQHTLHMTASLGVALFGPGLAESADVLLIQADAAMYEAKRRQRGTIQFFDENTQKYLNDQADMSNRLRGALAENDFKQYYQPQVDHEGRVVGVEALLRWHDPKLGDISPASFIPLAESLHLIVDIDRWVLKQACRVAGTWKKDPVMEQIVISINVSGEFFSQDDFLVEVLSYLKQFDAHPAQVMIEITEGTVVDDTEANIQKIKAIHDAGLGIAIDDFGTGNSSLAYLRRFDVDQIKIDQRFVHDMIDDERSLAITSIIIQLAHELGYETLAEGVENEAQRLKLITMGCTLLQGFLFSKALPLVECENYIRRANFA